MIALLPPTTPDTDCWLKEMESKSLTHALLEKLFTTPRSEQQTSATPQETKEHYFGMWTRQHSSMARIFQGQLQDATLRGDQILVVDAIENVQIKEGTYFILTSAIKKLNVRECQKGGTIVFYLRKNTTTMDLEIEVSGPLQLTFLFEDPNQTFELDGKKLNKEEFVRYWMANFVKGGNGSSFAGNRVVEIERRL